jgi:hypothetical protein
MTNQHPLTDSFLQSYYKYGDGPYDEDQMRDVADRQLEQCIAWLDDTDCDDPQETAQRLREAMRPTTTTTQENNND